MSSADSGKKVVGGDDDLSEHVDEIVSIVTLGED